MIRKVLKYIDGIRPLSAMDALDPFGGMAHSQTKYLSGCFNSLTVWEFAAKKEMVLLGVLPDADIKICDSFEEIKETKKRFDLIFMDPSITMSGDHIEAFDLFPHLFWKLKNRAILIHSLIWPGRYYFRQHSGKVPERILNERKLFYGVRDGDEIPLYSMCERYRLLAYDNGYSPQGGFLIARNHLNMDWFYYVMDIRKNYK